MRMAKTHRSKAPALAAFTLVLLHVTAPAATAEVVKSPGDPRAYEHLQLPNGLSVLLVSDPTTDRAAASLDVNVGSGSDPRGREGLAHLLEHMLFLGTEKYPEPGEYKSFIEDHGGSDNAFTSYDHTNYFFEIDAAHLEPALDRFAQFFVAPRFDPRYVDRERQVVHSEYTSKLESDGRRLYHARTHAMNPDHPAARFAVGSRETLADLPDSALRDELIAFYRAHYSAGLMALSVLGREPLAELREWVTARFAAIPDTGATVARVDTPLFRPGDLPALLEVVPIKDRRSLRMTFPIPALTAHWRSKPLHLIADLLGHEGPGSLLAELKAAGLAEALSAGPGFDSRDAATFEISIQLTEKGLGVYREVVGMALDAIALVRERGLEAWRYDELARISAMRFRFMEPPDPVVLVRAAAGNLHDYPPEEVLHAGFVMSGHDAALTRQFLDRLRPDNMLVTLVAKGLETDALTRFYRVGHRITRLQPEAIAAWRPAAPSIALALPERNDFIPERFALQPAEGASATPVRLIEAPGFTLWHQQDTTYRQPRADLFVSVRSPLTRQGAREAMLTALYVASVRDEVQTFAYPAAQAGLSYEVYGHARGFSLRLSGYSDKQEVLLQRLTRALVSPRIDPSRFEQIREDMVRRLRNRLRDDPVRRAFGEARDLLLAPRWTLAERIAAAEAASADAVRAFVPELLARVQVVALAHGNLSPEQAGALGATVRERLAAGAAATDVPSLAVMRLEAGERHVRHLAVPHPDSAAVVYLQGRERSFAERARFAVLAQLLGSPFFEELRTERKLGYVVYATSMPLVEVPGLAFVVQSPSTDPTGIASEIDAFVDRQRAAVAGLDAPALERAKTSVLSRVLEQENRLRERSERYWREIDREHYAFDSREQLAAAVRAIDLADLTAAFESLVAGADARRLAVHVTGSSHAQASAADGGGPAAAPQGAFQEGRERFPG
ncbi:MAG: insulinase family protein [Ectothiorhodospiraceae bacterium]|nr:insulinase family protein [Ectothiorhodospiraceae bacterium]